MAVVFVCALQAWLAGGEWHRLIPADHAGLPEVKWCMNRFVPFLAVDPRPDLNPGSRDAEEASMEVGSSAMLSSGAFACSHVLSAVRSCARGPLSQLVWCVSAVLGTGAQTIAHCAQHSRLANAQRLQVFAASVTDVGARQSCT